MVIKPVTPVTETNRDEYHSGNDRFTADMTAAAVGMSPRFVRRVVGRDLLTSRDVLRLIDQDSYRETFVRRSQVLNYLKTVKWPTRELDPPDGWTLERSDALEYLRRLRRNTVQCVVTSPPYWGTRIYDTYKATRWADTETCTFGHEQTPEEYLRHTTEILSTMFDVLTPDGSVWWNIMDSYNTRAPLRRSASETLAAMRGKNVPWSEQPGRRYSAGHSYLEDGEQCVIPGRVAQRASRLGYLVKSVITWSKTNSMPEPSPHRPNRGLEYILHLTKARRPKFNRDAYRTLPARHGGQSPWEPAKLGDVWTFPPTSGGTHGAQFPLTLPGRCIALSTDRGDVVLDPFAGLGTSGVAALTLGRRYVGVDISERYLRLAEERLRGARHHPTTTAVLPVARQTPLIGVKDGKFQ